MANRSVVKHSYIRASRSAVGRAKAHVNYVRFRPGKDKEAESREFFNSGRDEIRAEVVKDSIDKQPGYGVVAHKFILSPGVAGADVREYARSVMNDLSRTKGVELDWYGVVHENTANAHCHVIVMGKGLDGRFYKVSKRDHSRMKETGDKYLIERGLLKEERERESGKTRNGKLAERAERVGLFFTALKAGVKEYSRVMADGEKAKEPAKEKKQTAKDREEAALGAAPTYEQLLMKSAKREERERKEAEAEWREYCRPIGVDYQKGTSLQGEVRQFDRSSSIWELRELERDYKSGELPDQMGAKDAERLAGWIKEKYRERQKLEREAQGISRIEVEERSLSKSSSRAELVELARLDERGEVHLKESERLALGQWLGWRGEKGDRAPGGSVADKSGGRGNQSSEARKGPKTDRERLQDRLPGSYQREGLEAKTAEREVRANTEAARKENLKKQLIEQRKMEAQRETVDGAYTEKWGAWTSPIAAGPMGATSGGLRDLGPNEALRLLKIGIAQQAASCYQKEEIAKSGEAQRDLEQEQSKLVDNIGSSKSQSSSRDFEKVSDQETQDRKEADSFLREIKERKKKEADRDQSRDPDRFDEWTGR